jgi:hypothetical protein
MFMGVDVGYCYSFLDGLVGVLGGSEAVREGQVVVEKIPVYYPDYVTFYVVVRFDDYLIEVACLDAVKVEVRLYKGFPSSFPVDRFSLSNWYEMNMFQEFLFRVFDVVRYGKRIKQHVSDPRR